MLMGSNRPLRLTVQLGFWHNCLHDNVMVGSGLNWFWFLSLNSRMGTPKECRFLAFCARDGSRAESPATFGEFYSFLY
jgi:hypothetical protein